MSRRKVLYSEGLMGALLPIMKDYYANAMRNIVHGQSLLLEELEGKVTITFETTTTIAVKLVKFYEKLKKAERAGWIAPRRPRKASRKRR